MAQRYDVVDTGDKPEDEGVGGDSIKRNAGLALATQLSTAAFTAILTLYLVRALGPEEYGLFAVALGISGVLLRGADLGIRQSAARYVAEHLGDKWAITAVIGMSLRVRLTSAAAMAVGLFALAGPVADVYGVPDLAWPLRGIAVSLFGQNVMLFARSIFTAARRNSRGLVLVSSESAMELTASIALVALGTGATGAAFGRGIGYMFGALLGGYMLARFIGRTPLWGTGRSPVSRREFSGYAGAMLVVGGVFTVFSQIDVLLIGALLGADAAGLFSAPLRLIVVLQAPGLALAQGIAPRMARNRKERARPEALYKGLRYLLILQGLIFVPILVWAEPIVTLLLGPEYSESAAVLRALSPFVLMRGLSPLLSSPLNYLGESRRRIPIGIFALALNATIDVIFLPKIGIIAGAIGTDIAFAIYLAGHVWLCHKLLGLPLRPAALTAGRTLFAAAAMAIPLLAAGTTDLSAIEWIWGAAAGASVFVATLLLTREVSTAELGDLYRASIGRLRRS